MSAMPDAQVDEEPKCVFSPGVSGADIPEELFEHILCHITHDSYEYRPGLFRELHPPSAHLHVQTFTSLILVCKYFARICRPTLYRKVVLRNRQQLRGLLSLLDSGCAPFGKSLVVLTHSFSIEGGVHDSLWIHQVGTVLLPRMKKACIPFPMVELAVNDVLDGFEPFRTQLPRILPSSLYQHISKLQLQNWRFKSGDDLLRYLSSFRNLRSLSLLGCACETVTLQRTFLRPTHHLPFPETFFWVSPSLFPVMVARLLDWYARINSVPYLLHGQAEVLLIADIMGAFGNRLAYRMFCSMYSDTSHIFSDPRPSIVVKFRYGPPSEISNLVWLTLVLRDIAHYDIMIRDNTRNAGGASKVLPGLVDCITLLPHLETLRWIFRDIGATSDFVDTSYSELQRMHSAGQEMKIGYASGSGEPSGWESMDTSDSNEPSEWESMASILERFAPRIEALADEQASEATDEEDKNVPETDAGRSTLESTKPASELTKDASNHVAVA